MQCSRGLVLFTPGHIEICEVRLILAPPPLYTNQGQEITAIIILRFHWSTFHPQSIGVASARYVFGCLLFDITYLAPAVTQ